MVDNAYIQRPHIMKYLVVLNETLKCLCIDQRVSERKALENSPVQQLS